jgi:GAF domain-containing protein
VLALVKRNRKLNKETTRAEARHGELRKEIEARKRAEGELRACHRQQSALAVLGQTAIGAPTAAALINQAATVVAETLETEYSAVLELFPDREEVLLRAGVGWKVGLVGQYAGPAVIGTGAGLVVRSDAPVVIPDLREDTRFGKSAVLLEHGVISAVNVTIWGRACPWGTLGVYSTRQRSFTGDDVSFLQSVANVLSLAFERLEHEVARQQEQETIERLRAIQSITDTALTHLALDELLQALLGRLRTVLQTEYATVLLLDQARNALTVRAHDGWQEDVPRSSVPIDGTISGRVASGGRALIFNDLPKPESPSWNALYMRLQLRSAMGAPLLVQGNVIGVVSVASSSERRFTAEDLIVLQVVADRVAPAIEQGRLVETVNAARQRLKELSRRLLVAHEEARSSRAARRAWPGTDGGEDQLGVPCPAVRRHGARSPQRRAGLRGPSDAEGAGSGAGPEALRPR